MALDTALAVTGPGQSPTVWRERLVDVRDVALADLGSGSPAHDALVVLSAHPDDETIGAGRLLAAWTRAGGQARAVLASAGEACVDHVGARPPGLVERRLAEWRGALATLGVTPAATLGLPDGGLAGAEDDLVAGLLAALGDLTDAERTVLVAPHPADPHPDHQVAGRAATRVAETLDVRLWHYPVWLTYWAEPDVDLDGELVRVPTDAGSADLRTAALGWFTSQTEPLAPGWGPVVPAGMLEHHDDQLLVWPRTARC